MQNALERIRTAAAAATSLSAAVCASWLALHHPLWPAFALAAFVLWCVLAVRWPGLSLFVLPACLPAANLAPWTGWVVFDEFDLVVLGALAAGHARIAIGATTDRRPPIAPLPLPLLFLASTALAFGRGAWADGEPTFGWYDGYTDPLNSWRVAKGAIYAALLWPMLRCDFRQTTAGVVRRFAGGMLTGVVVVVVVAIWERAALPGLLNFAGPYRTVAWFWEMHVGGAAIDAYLVIAAPFVAWAVLTARRPRDGAAAALLALLFEYTCLTTFSRGVYLGVLGGMIALLLLRLAGTVPAPPWRRRAQLALILAMLAQGAAVLGSDSFLLARLKASPLDFGSRLAHWQSGLRLLSGPADWWLGKGLGRLPAEYAAATTVQEFSGAARVRSDRDAAYLRLNGPLHNPALAGRYALTQRITVAPSSSSYRAGFDVRVDQAVRIGVTVCETHLLYDAECQRGTVQLVPGAAPWQRVNVSLAGPRLPSTAWPPRPMAFAVTLLDPGVGADLTHIVLSGEDRVNLLRNADFSSGLAHWLPVCREYFVPWHIDNLYLELLIEQGVLGLAAFALAIGSAIAALRSHRTRRSPLAPVLIASLVGALLVGAVSSLLDVPRVAFLMFLITGLSIHLGGARDASGAP